MLARDAYASGTEESRRLALERVKEEGGIFGSVTAVEDVVEYVQHKISGWV